MADRITQIDEILPYGRPFDPAQLHRWVSGPGRAGIFSPPQPRIPLGPAGELLWQRVVPGHGLPAALRCLASLWRLPDEAELTTAYGPPAVAAGIERMICQRASLTGGRYADAAATYRVDEAVVRAVGVDLQARLRLSSRRWW